MVDLAGPVAKAVREGRKGHSRIFVTVLDVLEVVVPPAESVRQVRRVIAAEQVNRLLVN